MRLARAVGVMVAVCGLLGGQAWGEASIEVSPESLSLTIAAVTQPGARPSDAVDETTELSYTVNEGTYEITVKWGVGDAAPAGTALLITDVTVPTDCGTRAELPITLTDEPQELITGITQSTPPGERATVTYELRVVNLAELVAEERPVTLTYTITGT